MSALLASLFIEAGLALHGQVSSPRPNFDYWLWDVNETHNPYGVIAAGFDHDFSDRFGLRAYVRHESSIRVNDYGTDSAGVSVTWRPFK